MQGVGILRLKWIHEKGTTKECRQVNRAAAQVQSENFPWPIFKVGHYVEFWPTAVKLKLMVYKSIMSKEWRMRIAMPTHSYTLLNLKHSEMEV